MNLARTAFALQIMARQANRRSLREETQGLLDGK